MVSWSSGQVKYDRYPGVYPWADVLHSLRSAAETVTAAAAAAAACWREPARALMSRIRRRSDTMGGSIARLSSLLCDDMNGERCFVV